MKLKGWTIRLPCGITVSTVVHHPDVNSPDRYWRFPFVGVRRGPKWHFPFGFIMMRTWKRSKQQTIWFTNS